MDTAGEIELYGPPNPVDLEKWLDRLLDAPDMRVVYFEPEEGMTKYGEKSPETVRHSVTASGAINIQRKLMSSPEMRAETSDREFLRDFIRSNLAIPSDYMTRKRSGRNE